MIVGVLAIIYNNIDYVSFDGNQYGNIFLMIIGAVTISFVILLLSYALSRITKSRKYYLLFKYITYLLWDLIILPILFPSCFLLRCVNISSDWFYVFLLKCIIILCGATLWYSFTNIFKQKNIYKRCV